MNEVKAPGAADGRHDSLAAMPTAGPTTRPGSLKPTLTDDSLYRLLVEGVSDYAIYMLDLKGYVSSWNAGAERFKGYRAAEILGRHFSSFYTVEDRAEHRPARPAHCLGEWPV